VARRVLDRQEGTFTMSVKQQDKPERPNIVLILVDDMGYSDLGCFGGEIGTPNIDRMASEGVQFTQMYNCGRCCPSRASLLTGLYPHQAGIGHMTVDLGNPAYQGYLNEQCVTIAEVLGAAGYHTLMSGKWHIGGKYDTRRPESWESSAPGHPLPLGRGFERFYGSLAGCSSYYRPHTLMRQDRFIDVDDDEQFYYTDAISTEAGQLIREFAPGSCREKREPFFLYVGYTAPHWPLHALPEDIALYEGRYRQGWDQLRKDRYDRMVELGIIDAKWKISPRHEKAPLWNETPHKEWEDRRMAVYAAQVHRMDHGVGHILQALRETGTEENTLVLFLSDNGGCAELLKEDGPVRNQIYPTRRGEIVRAGNIPGVMPGSEETYMSYDLPWANASNTPFRLFKHWVHEGGISTPLVIRWPAGVNSHRMVHRPLHVVDIMATILQAAGVLYPTEYRQRTIPTMEGESFLPAIRGEPWRRQTPIYWEHEGNCALRQGDWKLVRKYPGPWELYNLEQDRTELNNYIEGEKARARQMIADWDSWADRCGVVPWERMIEIAPW
jgi:arylsulfatase A-like enzyme